MREKIKDPLRIAHMVEACNNILTFMKDKTLIDLKSNSLLFFGVVKNIEIIGEASYKISKEFKENHPEIPWKIITGMRHVLVHDYYHINPERVFNTYKQDIPELLVKLVEIQSREN